MRVLRGIGIVCCGALLFVLGAELVGAEDSVVALPPEVAADLALLGEGVVGKALPAPPIEDLRSYANPGPGEWDYEIAAGGKEGQKVRTESYKRLPDRDGDEVWERTLGTEFIEHLRFDHENGNFSTFLEDDVELGYTSRFEPALTWLTGGEAGKPRTVHSKLEAFKTGKPDDVSYTGAMDTTLTYVGTYEVTTPAGTWPAILLHSRSKIHIGPAKVDDSKYEFYAKGVGKIAEIESTRISALFIYNSKTRVAKLLRSYPQQ